MIIDTYSSVKTLEGARFTDKQAEGIVTVLANAFRDFVTKDDIKRVEGDLRKDIVKFEHDIRKDVEMMESRIKGDMEKLEMRLTIRTSSIVFSMMVFFKIFNKFIY